jgi:hypothetical protein
MQAEHLTSPCTHSTDGNGHKQAARSVQLGGAVAGSGSGSGRQSPGRFPGLGGEPRPKQAWRRDDLERERPGPPED